MIEQCNDNRVKLKILYARVEENKGTIKHNSITYRTKDIKSVVQSNGIVHICFKFETCEITMTVRGGDGCVIDLFDYDYLMFCFK